MRYTIIFIFLCVLSNSLHAHNTLEEYLIQSKLKIRNNQDTAAIAILYKGLERSIALKEIKYEGLFNLELANLLLYLNKVDSIDFYYSNALKIFKLLKSEPEIILAETGLLEVARRTNPSSTMDKYIDLLHRARDINNKEVYYNVLDKIILVNIGMENYKEAFAELHECINFYKYTKDTLKLAMKYRELGALFFTHLYSRTGKPSDKDSCIFYHEKAIKLFKKINSFRNLVFAYQRLAWLIYPDNLNIAWQYLQTADSLDKKYNVESPQLPNIMSFCLHKMGKTDEAILKSKEAMQKGLKAKQLFICIQAADALSEYYKSKKEIDSALHYREISAAINDSIRNQRQYKEAARMQAKIEYDKELFEKELTMKEENKRQALILRFTFIGIALLIIIAMLIFRAYNHTKKTEKIISKQNEEKSILLKEIHHRVKNNLTIISSILNLQLKNIEDDKVKEVFRDAKSRINSMALVHKNLYEQDNFAKIDTQEYFENLYKTIYDMYNKNDVTIIHHIYCNNVKLNIDFLIPLALITNELLTNTFKYAFEGKNEGTISMVLINSENELKFEYQDDGIGINLNQTNKVGLGSSLIKGLTKQINGKFEKIILPNGLKYIFVFENTHNQNNAIA